MALHFIVTQAPRPAPDRAFQQLLPPRQRKRAKRGPHWPPARVTAAIEYVSRCNDAMRPLRNEKSSRDVLGGEEYESSIQEQDLHPLQKLSYRAACDCLERYFQGDLPCPAFAADDDQAGQQLLAE